MGFSFPCPKCDSWDTFYSAAHERWLCNRCGNKFTREQGQEYARKMATKQREGTLNIPRHSQRRAIRTRQIGDTTGGYTIIALSGGYILWERQGATTNHYILDHGTSRVIATRDKDEAERELKKLVNETAV